MGKFVEKNNCNYEQTLFLSIVLLKKNVIQEYKYCEGLERVYFLEDLTKEQKAMADEKYPYFSDAPCKE